MNFEWGSALATRQDLVANMLLESKPIPDSDVRAIQTNWAVPVASVLCPCNLVIRHWCLQDMLDNEPKRYCEICDMCLLLSNHTGLWAEGYSYWCYTKYILQLYCEHFFIVGVLADFIQRQTAGFIKTAFVWNDRLYPAPFGDVWPGPMNEAFDPGQVRESVTPVLVYNDGLGQGRRRITSRGIRFNLHTAYVRELYLILDGVPIDTMSNPFKYYVGYDKKYPTRWCEVKAIMRRALDLLLSIFY